MKVYSGSEIRNVAVVGHNDTGKTSLVTQLLFNGGEVSTERVWKFAEEFELPRLIVINKMDRERASFSRTLDAVQKKFGKNVVPIQLPIGEEKDFSGIIDLVSMTAWKYAGDSGKFEKTDIPADQKAEADDWRAQL